MQIFFIIPYPDNMKKTELNITSVARTASGALSAFLRPPARPPPFPLPGTAEIRHDDFCVPAWLCTQVNEVRFQSAITIKPGKSRMTKQESAALNMAKFIRAQSLLLLEKLDVLDLDDEAADCERMHEQAEALYQKLSARFGIQDGE